MREIPLKEGWHKYHKGVFSPCDGMPKESCMFFQSRNDSSFFYLLNKYRNTPPLWIWINNHGANQAYGVYADHKKVRL